MARKKFDKSALTSEEIALIKSKPWCTVTEAAKLISCSVATLDRLRTTDGGPPFSKPANKVLYKVDDLLAWLESGKVTSTSQCKPRDYKLSPDELQQSYIRGAETRRRNRQQMAGKQATAINLLQT